MKTKKFLLISGLFVFLISIYVKSDFKNKEKLALGLDKTDTKYGMVEGPPPCSWEVNPPERIMAENKTQAISIKTGNTNDTDCESTLYLRAPGFDISPSKEDQKINLKPAASGSISWIITPRKVGSFEIAITDNINTKIFGVTVNNMLGLSAIQAKILSALGTLFGPMLTIPWWWDRFRKKPKEISQGQ